MDNGDLQFIPSEQEEYLIVNKFLNYAMIWKHYICNERMFWKASH